MNTKILITGSRGYIGQQLVNRLRARTGIEVWGLDITPVTHSDSQYVQMDIRAPELGAFMAKHMFTHVIHLASVVSPSHDAARDFDIDVNGTRNLLKACVAHDVRHLTVTSSGAAYGYYQDNPEWIKETDRLRGNQSFSYSYHKRLIEEMLAGYRDEYPTLKQLILRPGTILGKSTRNLITNLFEGKALLAIRGSATPFVFIWDEDVLNIIEHGCVNNIEGAFNLAGDGVLGIREIAKRLNKPTRELPAGLLAGALWIARLLKLTRYGPDQVDFLRYRPVLDNAKLKAEFAYVPQKTSAQTFEYYLQHNPHLVAK